MNKARTKKLIIVAIILFIVIVIGVFLQPRIQKCMEISEFINKLFAKENQFMNVELMVEIGEDKINLNAKLFVCWKKIIAQLRSLGYSGSCIVLVRLLRLRMDMRGFFIRRVGKCRR